MLARARRRFLNNPPLPTAMYPRVAVVAPNGNALRHVPRATAQAMVDAGIATPAATNGRVREVILAKPASTHAARIGAPSAPSVGGVRFFRYVHLELSGARIVEHHPRCLLL